MQIIIQTGIPFLIPLCCSLPLQLEANMADVQAHTARLIALFVGCVLYGMWYKLWL
jgi:hypothetical protein